MFSSFFDASTRSGVVSFFGRNSVGQTTGVYKWTGGTLEVVADATMAIPGGVGNFAWSSSSSDQPSAIWGNEVAFHGLGAGNPGWQEGIYLRAGGTLTRIIDRNTPAPGGGPNFSSLGKFSMDGTGIAFTASASSQHGVYEYQDGVLSTVATLSTPVPGGTGTFTNFHIADRSGGSIAFVGLGANLQAGVYIADTAGSISRRYDRATPVPGGTGLFQGFSVVSYENGAVAFMGEQATGNAVFADVGGPLSMIADLATPVPGVPGATFVAFSDICLNDGIVAFTGKYNSGTNTGVFTTHGGQLRRVLANGDWLDGQHVVDVQFTREGLSGDSVVVSVLFQGGTHGVYVATIPGPAPSILVSVGVVSLAVRRRRS